MSALLERLTDTDRDLFLEINGGLHRLADHFEPLDSFFRLLNEFGSAWILLVVLFAIIALETTPRRAMRRVLELGLAALLGGLGANRLKLVFERPRPRTGLADAFADGRAHFAFGEAYRSFSFPSGHSALVFSLAAVLVWWTTTIPDPWRRTLTRTVVLLGATSTALARIYAGSHYPADALAGAGLGLLAGGISAGVSRRALGPYAP